MRKGLRALLVSLLAASPVAAQESALNKLTDAERADGWRLLFDGTSLDQWRGYQRTDLPDGWQAVDGLLTRVARAGDIITRDSFGDFELVFEFNVEPGGNSGVFYRATEEPELIYYFAPEYQILDDERHRDGGSQLTSTGAAYGLVPAPRGVTRQAGEWNTGRIVVRGDAVEHWLNGERIVQYDRSSDDWRERVRASKFHEWPGFGLADRGHIGLQDHGSRVAYRNLKVRPL
jgi:hypothetical protein